VKTIGFIVCVSPRISIYTGTCLFVLLAVHLSIILDNEQLDAHLLYFTIRLL